MNNVIIQPGVRCPFVVSKIKDNKIEALIDNHPNESYYYVFEG
jgi:hypothetical protein